MAPRTGSAPLRWGLLLEEHPAATKSFRLADSTEVPDIPPEIVGRVCICTIDLPDGRTFTGWHESSANSITAWDAPSTGALDAALINAGYPPTQEELIFLMRWRFRRAEVEAVRLNTLRGAGDPPEPQSEKDRIAAEDDSHVLEIDGSPDVTDPAVLNALHARLDALSDEQKSSLLSVLEHTLIDVDDVMTEAQVSFVNKAIDNLTGERR